MASYERTYATARTIYLLLAFVGWIIVGVGCLAAIVGLATGGLLGSFAPRGSAGIIVHIVAMIPGVMIAAVGLFVVANVQTSRATVDSAEMTREMLALARQTSVSEAAPPKPESAPPAPDVSPIPKAPGPPSKVSVKVSTFSPAPLSPTASSDARNSVEPSTTSVPSQYDKRPGQYWAASYRGFPIYLSSDDLYCVGDRSFKSLKEAEAFINRSFDPPAS